MKRLIASFAVSLVVASPLAAAEPAANAATLARDVGDVAALAAVRRLHHAYAAYAGAGLWSEIADLFAEGGEMTLGDATVRGPDAIRRALLAQWGGGREGLAPGGVRVMLPLTPVINLGADGRTAQARWHELGMLGTAGGEASWTGGIYENDYVLEGGVWRIARMRYHPQFAGSYATGWRNLERDIKVVPYHYTPESAGMPIPLRAAVTTVGRANLPALGATLARLTDEQAVTNLQNAYGYYVDQRMWDDVADLFERTGRETVDGVGTWTGAASIRRGLERDGPQGLGAGELNNHVQLGVVVTVSPDGQEAHARGLDLGMTGRNTDRAYWSVADFENRYVKRDGIWRIAEVHLSPRFKSDYAQGWAKSRIVDPPLPAATAPDMAALAGAPGALLAFSFANPVTGRLPHYPAGAAVRPVTTGWTTPVGPRRPAPTLAALDLQRRRIAAYVGAENVSNAFGNYIDDFSWANLGRLFAVNGLRGMPYSGYFRGPEHITKAEVTHWGWPKSPRLSIPIHLRTQPVIDVAADGRSARFRTRLFSIGSSWDKPGMFSGGMYPNDQAVLEDGRWKLWSVSIDEFYYNSATYADGWTKVPHDPAEKKPDMLLAAYPPDIPLTALGRREQAFIPGSTEFNPYIHNGPAYPGYPSAAPMWFSYKNPVSGRMPKYYWPDCATCVAFPKTSLAANGY